MPSSRTGKLTRASPAGRVGSEPSLNPNQVMLFALRALGAKAPSGTSRVGLRPDLKRTQELGNTPNRRLCDTMTGACGWSTRQFHSRTNAFLTNPFPYNQKQLSSTAGKLAWRQQALSLTGTPCLLHRMMRVETLLAWKYHDGSAMTSPTIA